MGPPTTDRVARHSGTVCLFRYHSPINRVNWGGRATSLALAGIIERAGRSVTETVGAKHIVKQISGIDETADYAKVDDLARVIVDGGGAETPETLELRAKLEAVDEVVINGEGDFILTHRPTLLRTLGFMRAAQRMGKPVHLVNSILSYGPQRLRDGRVEADAIAAVGDVLSGCATVMYRDPGSAALHQEHYAGLSASWAPDALFSWAEGTSSELGRRGAFTVFDEGVPLDVQRLIASDQPYVVLSGTSLAVPGDAPRMTQRVAELAAGLRSRGISTVYVCTDTPDGAWAGFLPPLGVETPSVKIPLSAAARTLWNATAMISGRYHPSILASLGGTPIALMASNSHKTKTLSEVITSPVWIPELPFFDTLDSVDPLLDFVDEVTRSGRRLRHVIRKRAIANGRRVTKALHAALVT